MSYKVAARPKRLAVQGWKKKNFGDVIKASITYFAKANIP
jgi:hypothetical protein